MINNLPKNLSALSALCANPSKVTKWGATTGVHLECQGWIYEACATNGRVLGLVRGHETQEPPQVKALETAPNTATSAVIGQKDWQEAFKLIPKKTFVAENENLGLVIGEKSVSFGATDGERARTLETMPVDGRFPNYRQAIPQGKPSATVSVDAKLLIETLKVAIAYSPEPTFPAVTLELRDEKTCIVIRTRNETQEFTGLVLPLVPTR